MVRSACLAFAVAALTAVGVAEPGAAAAPTAAPSAPARPAPVRDVAPFDTGSAVRITWTNPDSAFAGVTVRYTEGLRVPTDPTEGTPAHIRSPRSTSVRLAGLTPGTRYTVAVWTYDLARHYSRPRVARFNTLPAPEADATISGSITDTSGHPLENVHVYVQTFSASETGGTTTDADGHYSLSVRPGGYYIGFDGALAHGGNSDPTGYVGATTTVDEVAPGETRTGVDAALDPGAAIVGRVSDAAGHPLAGVVPTVETVEPYVATTNSSFSFFSYFGPTLANPSAVNGTFAIKGLPRATLLVCLDPTIGTVTGGTSDLVGYVGRCGTRSVITQIARTRVLGVTTLAAARGGVLTGVVADRSGAPAARAFVSASAVGRNDFADGGYGYTDANGRYRFTVPAGTYRVCADPGFGGASDVDGTAACTPDPVAVRAGHLATADIRLGPAGSVAGRILGPDGHPVSHASVEIEQAGRRFSGVAYGETDDRGEFLIKGVPAGDFYACVYPPPVPSVQFPTGIAPGCVRKDSPVRVRLGWTRLGLDGRLTALGGAISGHVTDDLGAPLSNAIVLADGGAFGFGVGVASDGTYTIVGLPAGVYRLCAIAFPAIDSVAVGFVGFGSPCAAHQVSVSAGQKTDDVDLLIPTRGSVTVSVTDEAGRPIGGVDVAALRTCSPTSDYCTRLPLFGSDPATVAASAVTDVDGTVTLDRLRPGQYAICLFAYYGATAEADSPTGYADSCNGSGFDVTVVRHQTTQVTRELAVAGAVSGLVTDESGNPLSGVAVSVSNSAVSDYFDPTEFFPYVPDGPAADAVTDTSGRFVIRGVTPGDQTVCVSAAHARGGTSTTGYLDACVGGRTPRTATPISVVARQRTTTRLTLTRGAAISGMVTTSTGHPRFREAIAFRGRHGYFAQVARSGAYRIDRLPAGTYQVCFVADRYRPQCFDHVAWGGRRFPKNATRIVLAAGQERRGVDAVLHRI